MITWVLYLCIGIIIGGMAGFYFARLDDLSKKQKQELEEKLQKSERELVDYKDQVTTHFRETAALINNMTESYQKVHEHLAQGSVDLCNNAIEVNKLTVSSNQLLSSSSDRSQSRYDSDADKATSLTESEAPKNSSANKNNKSESTNVVNNDVNAASEKSRGRKINESSEPVSAVENQQSMAADSTSTTKPDTPSTSTASSAPTNSADTNSANVKQADQPQSPVLETMAVAEEDPSENTEQEDSENTRLPGSRMVH